MKKVRKILYRKKRTILKEKNKRKIVIYPQTSVNTLSPISTIIPAPRLSSSPQRIYNNSRVSLPISNTISKITKLMSDPACSKISAEEPYCPQQAPLFSAFFSATSWSSNSRESSPLWRSSRKSRKWPISSLAASLLTGLLAPLDY